MDLSIALKIAKDPESSPEQLDVLFGQGEEVERLLARHMKTTAGLLERLSHSSDRSTRRYVVGNPNATKAVLLKLAPQFPLQFFLNPILDWLIVEDPELLLKIGGGVLKNILKRRECPVSIMKWAVINGTELEIIALLTNSNVSEDILKILSEKNDGLGLIAKSIYSKNPEILKAFLDLEITLDHPDHDVLETFLRQENCPIEIMKWIANEELFYTEKLILAANPNLSVEILDLLIKSEYKGVRDAANSHVKFSADVVELDPHKVLENSVKEAVSKLGGYAKDYWQRKWIDSGQWQWLNYDSRLDVIGLEAEDFEENRWRDKYAQDIIAAAILKRDRTTIAEDLMWLKDSKPSDLRKHIKPLSSFDRTKIAVNPSVPVALLEILAKDKNVQVLCGVSINPSSPSELLEILASHKSKSVREAVASNINISPAVMKSLSRDMDYGVRKHAAVTLNSLDMYLQICAERGFSKLYKICDKFSGNYNNRSVLQDIELSDVSLEFFSRECEFLRSDPGASFIAKLIGSNRCTVDLKDSFAASTGLSYGNDECNRLLGLCNSDSRGALFGNYKSESWIDRLAIASNPYCPPDLLEILARDAHRLVSKMARDRLPKSAKKIDEEVKKSVITVNKIASQANELIPSKFTCPNCSGTVKEDNGIYNCCGVEAVENGCGFSFSKTQAGRAFKPAEVELLLREHKSGLLRGFISKAGKPFNAEMVLRFDETKKTCRVVFDFVKDKKPEPAVLSTATGADVALQPSLGACPKCGAGVHAHGTNYVCANSLVSPTQAVPSCDFKTGQVILQQAISTEQLGKLLTVGRTDLLDGFISARTQKAFKAMLVWDGKAGKVGFEFGSSRA